MMIWLVVKVRLNSKLQQSQKLCTCAVHVYRDLTKSTLKIQSWDCHAQKIFHLRSTKIATYSYGHFHSPLLI